MSEEPTGTAHGVDALFTRGRLLTIPRKAARREQLLTHLAQTLFSPGHSYTETEVNGALRTVHDDCAALRRYLVESGRLTRTRDGRAYHRPNQPATATRSATPSA